MSIIVRHTGDHWTVEVDGSVVGEANTEANVEAIVATLRAKQTWVASWRFCDLDESGPAWAKKPH
jgi:hypothetical protein